MKRTSYSKLQFLPWIMAENVFDQAMDTTQRREFAFLCNQRCKRAYKAEAPWFERLVKAQDNSGRDGLYAKIRGWHLEYLKDPAKFKKDSR